MGINRFFKGKQATNSPPPPVMNREAPWLMAQRAYEDTYLKLAAQVVNWRRITFLSLLITGIAVSGVVYIGAQSKFVPYVVEVDKLGRALAVRSLQGAEATRDPARQVYADIFELIENLRTVTTDREANNRNLNRAFAKLGDGAKNYVRTELRKAPPNEVGATKTVQVRVTTALKLSEKVWQVEWEEVSFNMQGDQIDKPELWKATLEYELEPGETEEAIRKNAVGLKVLQLNWAKVIL